MTDPIKILGWVGIDPICSVCRRTSTWLWRREDGSVAFAACEKHRREVMRKNGLAEVRRKR